MIALLLSIAFTLTIQDAVANNQVDPHLALLSYIKVKPGCEERFRKEVATIVEPSRSEPGNIAWFVQEDKEDPTQFVFYTRWMDEDALKFHLTSPPLVRYLERTAPLLAEPARLVRLTPVDE